MLSKYLRKNIWKPNRFTNYVSNEKIITKLHFSVCHVYCSKPKLLFNKRYNSDFKTSWLVICLQIKPDSDISKDQSLPNVSDATLTRYHSQPSLYPPPYN